MEKIKQPLVTMITYCYNGARFVSKYFDAILAQTYSNIELIFFNNGSEDSTGQIAESYRDRLEQKGVQVNIIHYKENQSTCQLKQDAFKMMKGEYFFGCDSDDLIDPTYVEEMSKYLIDNPDKGIVYCQLRVIKESTGEQLSISKMLPRTESKQAFKDILTGYNINFTAISYMMSKKHFERINPKKEIFISRFGENYQVQMPFLYHDLQGYINKPLGQYTVRDDSYTGTLNVEKKVRAFKGQEESVLHTLQQICGDDYEGYKKFFLKRIRRERFMTAMFGDDKYVAKECRKELKEVQGFTFKLNLYWLLYKVGLFKKMYKTLKKA